VEPSGTSGDMLEDGVDASEVFGDGDGHLDTLREGVDIITIIESLFFNYISVCERCVRVTIKLTI
jgi:hypothetical protein